jgi:hypothetical protein
MNFADYYRLLSEKPDLMAAVMTFNGLAEPPPEMAGALADHPLVREIWSRPDLRSFFPKKSRPGFWDFQDESRRLVLVDPEAFRQTRLYWGAALFAEDLALVIAREEVAELKKRLGSPIYHFALTNGRFYLGSLRPALRWPSDPAALSPETLETAGLEAASICAASWPEKLRSAAEARFQIELDPRPEQARRLEAVWPWLKKILLEVAPQWRPCFA